MNNIKKEIDLNSLSFKNELLFINYLYPFFVNHLYL